MYHFQCKGNAFSRTNVIHAVFSVFFSLICVRSFAYAAKARAFGQFPMPAKEWRPAEWPVLKHYDNAHLRQIALPSGGAIIACKTSSGRGKDSGKARRRLWQAVRGETAPRR